MAFVMVMLGMVLREEVEIGLMRPIQHADVLTAPVYDDELVLVTIVEVEMNHVAKWLGC